MSGSVSAVPAVPLFLKDANEHRRKLALAVNTILDGKINATFRGVTLAASEGSTTLTDPRIGYYTFVALMPTSADAAKELASGNVYFDTFVSGNGKAGSCTIHHTNNSETDRTFVALLIG